MRLAPQIVRLVHRRQALMVIARFQCGWSVVRLSRYFGLSQLGVQELIRHYGNFGSGIRRAGKP
jgi:hypothetical protein